jgi:hypothetical protein
MPLISPNLNIEEYDIIEQDRAELINDTLLAGGIPQDKLPAKLVEDEDKFRKTLNYCGASIENASKTISHVMHHGKYDHVKLRAAEMVLELHGVKDKENQTVKQPIFQFLIKDSDVNINQIFSPAR